MILERRAVDPFQKNGFVIGCEETREGVIVDPGDEVRELLDAAKAHQLKIVNILLTHAHLDHVTGVAEAKQATNVPVWLHKDDNFLYDRVVEQGQMFGLRVKRQRAAFSGGGLGSDRQDRGRQAARPGALATPTAAACAMRAGDSCANFGCSSKIARGSSMPSSKADADLDGCRAEM
jgi:glyoxylase-like metal-dependent hydrolase (beta-lactamase superfamily II)